MVEQEIKPEDKIIKEFNIQEITADNLALMEKQILEIPETPEDKTQYESVKEMHISAKKLPKLIEDRRVELKASILKKGRDLDAAAKNAKGMVSPLIELSSSRRFAWEKIAEDKKAKEAEIEQSRTDKIDTSMGILDNLVSAGQAFNLSAGTIKIHLLTLEDFEISEEDFQEKTEMAEMVKASGIETLTNLLESRVKWEADQKAHADKLKAEQEAAAKAKEENEAKAKDLAEKTAAFEKLQADIAEKRKADQAKIDAAQKIKDDTTAKIAVQEEEKTKQANAKLEKDRLALEKEKAEMELEKYTAMWNDAIYMNRRIVNDSAKIMNIKFDEFVKKEESDKKDQLKKDKARAKLIEADKKILTQAFDDLDVFIDRLNPLPKGYETNSAAQIELDLVVKINRALDEAREAQEDLA
jgi:hypothetical protein